MMPAPLLLGHRGARATKSIPENTVASFDLALAHGCDGFEFDVRRTADGRAVICHDPHYRGIEIAKAEAGHLTDLPVLDQVLERFAGAAFLDIEIKVSGLERTVLDALSLHPPKNGYVISSFQLDVLQKLRMLATGAPLGLLCEDRSQLSAWTWTSAQFLIPHYALIDDRLCTKVHAGGKKILAWTVNEAETMRRLQAAGVDGIISDDTSLLVSTFKQKG